MVERQAGATSNWRARSTVWVLRLALVAALLGAWLYATGPGGVSQLLLPRMRQVVDVFVGLVLDHRTWSAAGITLIEIAIALGLAIALGFACGFVASRSSFRVRVVEPLLAWGYMVPTVLFYPLFVLWFGVGIWSKILYAVLAAFFPIAYSTTRGFQSVDRRYTVVCKAFGASSMQTDLLVKFPAALPMMLSGVRVGGALVMISVILGEMLGGSMGLGYELRRASEQFEIPQTWALIVIILLVVAALQALFALVLAPPGRGRRRM